MPKYLIIPSPLSSFLVGFGGVQTLLYHIAINVAWWRPVLGGAFAIYGLISWRLSWVARQKEHAELIARIRARGHFDLTIP